MHEDDTLQLALGEAIAINGLVPHCGYWTTLENPEDREYYVGEN